MTAVLKEGRKSQEHHAVPGAFVCLSVCCGFVLLFDINLWLFIQEKENYFFVGQSSCLKESKKETVLRLLVCFFFFPVDVLIYWYADLETTSMLGSCLILIVYYSSTFFEAQKKKGDHASLNFSIIGIFM